MDFKDYFKQLAHTTRKMCITLPSVLLLCACQKPYEKAVKDYIQEHFNDPESYECVELSEPKAITLFDYYVRSVREKAQKEDWPFDSICDKIGKIRPFLEEQGEDPNKVLLRYVEHTYRANNRLGGKLLKKEKWYLNDDLTEVISIDTE